MKQEPIKTSGPDNIESHVADEVEISNQNSAIALSGIVSVANTSDGRLEVFGVGPDKAVCHNGQTTPQINSPWSGWSSFSGQVTSKPAVFINSDCRLQVFARGMDNALWNNRQTAPNATWSGWQSLGGSITSNPAVYPSFRTVFLI